jgi:uncharacterized LabA/DUF88 family protein
MATNENDKLAVLIDADNAQASVVHELLEEVARYGTASVKRAYGDWTTTGLTRWKNVLHAMAIQPIQQFAYTRGKNATDSALIIDAMDLLHTGDLNGFCLVSSDSDFTRLATRLREAGLKVYGFGERKTPEPFVAACDKFIYTDILKPSKKEPGRSSPKAPALKPQLVKAIEAVAQDDGWAYLGGVGSMLVKNSPAFDPRNYGHKKLGELVKKQTYLRTKEVSSSGSRGSETMVSLK